ncbi:esterase/lipase family protein [Kitasatospora griseola]|uniref:esterase/lipase family protein n=1 Tax=Kitasatospora griseola TaxID=2064 RepID=UPI0038052550
MTAPQGELADQALAAFSLAAPITDQPSRTVSVPEPNEKWPLPYGEAWVFRGEGNDEIIRPVLMADGFNVGKSELDKFAQGLDADFPLLSTLRAQQRDVILIGFDERSASITVNADTVIAAIHRTLAQRIGNARLTVGGFSMGGLVTRYALAKLENDERIDHETGLYLSFDSPHRGASVPVGIQAFAHLIPFPNKFAKQMNSPAARQLLWQHYDPATKEIGVAPERTAFLAELERVGNWPRMPRLIGVANGRGDGIGLPEVKPGDVALELKKSYKGSTFSITAQGNGAKAADLYRAFPKEEQHVTTDGFPELDGAPGGTLHTYKILADTLKDTEALKHPNICFVPTVSAVAVRDIATQADLYAKVDDIDPNESELDDFLVSSSTTGHTIVTEELATWLVNRLPE